MDLGLADTLASGSAYDKLLAIRAAAEAGPAAATLVPALAALLSSEEYVPDIRVAHDLLCERAAQAIRRIGVAPAVDTLRALLADDRVMDFPVACFDQGVYVGDYATQEVAPAGLAAQLVPLHGVHGLRLLPELLANARRPTSAIADPAERAIAALVAAVSGSDRALGTELRRAIDAHTLDGSEASRLLPMVVESCINRIGSPVVQDNRPPR